MGFIAPFIGPAIAVAGALGTLHSGATRKESVDLNAAVAEENVEIQSRLATQQVRAGKLRAEQVREQGGLLIGQQAAKFAHGGVTSEGTPLEVMMRSAQAIEMDAVIAEENAKLGAEITMRQAAGLEAKAGSLRAEAKDIRYAAPIAAVTRFSTLWRMLK